jgi:hypothetical protein
MGRGLSEQQIHVLQTVYKNESSARHRFAEVYTGVFASADAKTISASTSRTLARLVQRGLIEKFYFSFGPQKQTPWGTLTRRGEFRWRLTEKGKKLLVNFRRQKLTDRNWRGLAAERRNNMTYVQFAVDISNYQGKERVVSDFAQKFNGNWSGDRVVFELHENAEKFMMAVEIHGIGCSIPREIKL